MNDTTVATPKAKTEVTTVKMEDGRLVDFPGKKRLQKESFVDADGTIHVRLDFRNGRTLSYHQPADSPLRVKSASHGLEQKLGDETAGEDDIEDAILAVEQLITRLDANEWSTKREGGGMSGTSILLRAIVNVTGKSVEGIKLFLSKKTQAQKMDLRNSDTFRAEVAKLEAEKKSKSKAEDTSKQDIDELMSQVE